MAMPAMSACVGYSHIGISHKGVLSANAMKKVLAEICIPVKGGCKSVRVPIALAEVSTSAMYGYEDVLIRRAVKDYCQLSRKIVLLFYRIRGPTKWQFNNLFSSMPS